LAGRPNEQREKRLVAEWLQLTYPDAYYQLNVRLGSLPLDLGTSDTDTPEARLVHNAFARWADAIVFLDDRTVLVEGKIVAHPVALAELEVYERILPASPYLNLPRDRPIEKVLVYAKPDALVTQLAHEKGVRLAQYDPPWVDEYLATKAARKRSGSVAQELAPVV
jgi:hypothetical protein